MEFQIQKNISFVFHETAHELRAFRGEKLQADLKTHGLFFKFFV
jgi:hypothetical protein